MSINAIKGFLPSKIQSLTISSNDCKKYGIKIEDFNKVDKNEDGLIDANEFLSKGIGDVSIFNAFKTLAEPMGGYTTETKETNQSNEHQNSSDKNKQFNLNHPNVANPFTGQKYDVMA